MAQIKSGTVFLFKGSNEVYGDSNVQWDSVVPGSLFVRRNSNVSYPIEQVYTSITPKPVTVNVADDTLTFSAAHGLVDGRPVTIGGDVAPAPLGIGALYFIRSVSSTEVKVYTSAQNALDNVNSVDLTTTGTAVKVVPTDYITLHVPYNVANEFGVLYSISKDFTPNFDLPLLSVGDVDAASLINRSLAQLDELISQLSVSLGSQPVLYSVNTTLDLERLVLANGNITLTLPLAGQRINSPFTIYNIGTSTVTIAPESPQEINGLASFSLPAGNSVIIESDGVKYFTVSGILSVDRLLNILGRKAEARAALDLSEATTVTSGVSFNQPAVVGTSLNYARADHSHGTPLLAANNESDGSKATASNDVRLSNARTPLSHNTSHVTGGSDVIPNAVPSGNAGLLSGADKAKLDGIATGANLYVHPTGDGNSHVPATGTNNLAKFLRAGATVNSAAWADVTWGEVVGKPSTFPPTIGSGSGDAVAGNDSRLTNARVPTSHVIATNAALGAEHSISGATTGAVLRASSATTANFQRLSWGDVDGKPTTFAPIIGSTADTAVAGNDSRLTDARTPVSHVIASDSGIGPEHTISGGVAGAVLRASSATAANLQRLVWSDIDNKPTTFAPIIGSGANEAVAGNDSRLSNARTPVGTTLNAAHLYVGNASNVATAVLLSGAATISNTGVVSLTDSAITIPKLANQSPGSIITWNASSLPIALAPSSISGYALLSNGINAAPSWGPINSIGELNWYETSELVVNLQPNSGYILNQQPFTFTVTDVAGNIVTTDRAHGFSAGQEVMRVLSTDTLPNGLTPDTQYFVSVPSATALRFHLTQSDAIAGINAVNITNTGVGTHTLGMRVALILPSGAAAGKVIRIVSVGNPTWYLQQGLNQYVQYGSEVTPIGTTGRVFSNDNRTNIELVVGQTNNQFIVTKLVGGITLSSSSTDPGFSGQGSALPMPYPADPAYAASTITITGTKSLTGGGSLSDNRTIELVNDSSSPAANSFYGTNWQGTRGFYPIPSRRNLIINSHFDNWRRGVNTQSFTNAFGYTADRWLAQTNSATLVVTRRFFTFGQTNVPDTKREYVSLETSGSASNASYTIYRQRVEGVDTCNNETVTLSFWAKANSGGRSISVVLSQHFGSGGSPSATVNIAAQKVSVSNNVWTRYVMTFNIPSLVGKTIGTNNDDHLAVAFWLSAGSDFNAITSSLGHQNGQIDLAAVQLEKANTATQTEVRPAHEDTFLCERYYRTVAVNWRGPAQSADQYFGVNVMFNPGMRTTPSLTLTAGTRNLLTLQDLVTQGNSGARVTYRSTGAGDAYAFLEVLAANAEL